MHTIRFTVLVLVISWAAAPVPGPGTLDMNSGQDHLDHALDQQGFCSEIGLGSCSLAATTATTCVASSLCEDPALSRSCEPGSEPHATQTVCSGCSDGKFSAAGVRCVRCESPNAVNLDQTACIPPVVSHRSLLEKSASLLVALLCDSIFLYADC